MANNRSTYIIAEAGVNHNGSLDLALEMINAASDAGADAIKFQTFNTEKLVIRDAPKAKYQITNTTNAETQYEMLKRLELSEEDHVVLAKHCKHCDIDYLSSPFDDESLKFLVEHVDIERLKLGSGEITNGPLLLQAARANRPIILSTGMSNLGEIETALQVLAFGYTEKTGAADRDAFRLAYSNNEVREVLARMVTLLHCNTEYPTSPEDVNLRAMDTISAAFRLPVGLSDHTKGITVAIAAVSRGACVLEKHFTLDRGLPGPDQEVSLEPSELEMMVSEIRKVEQALGTGIKAATESEIDNMKVVRKSLVAARDIAKGEVLDVGNVTIKRPGSGISPMHYWDYMGKKTDRAYKRDELIDP